MELTILQVILIVLVPMVVTVMIVFGICYRTLQKLTSILLSMPSYNLTDDLNIINDRINKLSQISTIRDKLINDVINKIQSDSIMCDRCNDTKSSKLTLCGGLEVNLCKDCSSEWNKFCSGLTIYRDLTILNNRVPAIINGTLKIPQNKFDHELELLLSKKLTIENGMNIISIEWMKSDKGSTSNHFLSTGKYLDAAKYFNINSLIDDEVPDYEGPHRLSDFSDTSK